ncbi:MAG TPA: hypothetical protein VHZ78_02115 [Rhizomicrobium sp.]|jgi:hypothetical protein|nr:hypothetical protein [Rhizomicrobium sp.]
MSATLVIQILEALAATLGQLTPLFAQGQAVLSLEDAAAVHTALTKAEASTAALRPQVDAALDAAALR